LEYVPVIITPLKKSKARPERSRRNKSLFSVLYFQFPHIEGRIVHILVKIKRKKTVDFLCNARIIMCLVGLYYMPMCISSAFVAASKPEALGMMDVGKAIPKLRLRLPP